MLTMELSGRTKFMDVVEEDMERFEGEDAREMATTALLCHG